MNIFNPTNIGLAFNALAVILVWRQLRQSYNLERASFTHSLNNELNEFLEVRVILMSLDEEKINKIEKEKYERILDYFTVFENIFWMIRSRALKVDEAKMHFGSRFYEAFYSYFFQLKSKKDQSFRDMYRMLYDLNDLFDKSSVESFFDKSRTIV